MASSDANARTTRPGPSRKRAGRPQTGTAGSAGSSESSQTGTRTAGSPDAAEVIRAVRVLREVVGEFGRKGDPPGIVVLPVDGVVPVLDAVLRMLEGPPTRVP